MIARVASLVPRFVVVVVTGLHRLERRAQHGDLIPTRCCAGCVRARNARRREARPPSRTSGGSPWKPSSLTVRLDLQSVGTASPGEHRLHRPRLTFRAGGAPLAVLADRLLEAEALPAPAAAVLVDRHRRRKVIPARTWWSSRRPLRLHVMRASIGPCDQGYGLLSDSTSIRVRSCQASP